MSEALQTAGARSPRRRRRRHRLPTWFLVPAVALLAAFALYPLVVLVRMSLSDVGPADILSDWEFVGLDNYATLLADGETWRATLRTVGVAAVLLASNFVLGFLGASILAPLGRVAEAVLALLVFVWALPPLVSGTIWSFLLDDRGVVNSALRSVGLPAVPWFSSPDLALWGVTAIIAWSALPFSVLVIRGGLLGVSKEVVEAAALDGAGYWATQLRIVLPQIAPTLGMLGILTVLYAFKSFDFFYVTTQGGPGTTTNTLAVLAYDSAFGEYEMSTGATIAVISMLLVAVFAVPYIRGVRREERA